MIKLESVLNGKCKKVGFYAELYSGQNPATLLILNIMIIRKNMTISNHLKRLFELSKKSTFKPSNYGLCNSFVNSSIKQTDEEIKTVCFSCKPSIPLKQ
jgi:hypothetical protein